MYSDKRHKINLIKDVFISFMIMIGTIGLYYGIEFAIIYESFSTIECATTPPNDDNGITNCYYDLIDLYNDLNQFNCSEFANNLPKLEPKLNYGDKNKKEDEAVNDVKNIFCSIAGNQDHCKQCVDKYENYYTYTPDYIFNAKLAFNQIISIIYIASNVIFTIYIFIYHEVTLIKDVIDFRISLSDNGLRFNNNGNFTPENAIGNFYQLINVIRIIIEFTSLFVCCCIQPNDSKNHLIANHYKSGEVDKSNLDFYFNMMDKQIGRPPCCCGNCGICKSDCGCLKLTYLMPILTMISVGTFQMMVFILLSKFLISVYELYSKWNYFSVKNNDSSDDIEIQ